MREASRKLAVVPMVGALIMPAALASGQATLEAASHVNADVEAEELIITTYDLSNMQRSVSTLDDQRGVIVFPVYNAGIKNPVHMMEWEAENCVSRFFDLHWDELEAPGRFLEAGHNGLVTLRGSAQLHADFKAWVAAYQSWVDAHVKLQFHVTTVKSGAAPIGGLVSAAEADAWLAGQGQQAAHTAYTMRVPLHALGSVQAQIFTPATLDVQVQIAHSSVMAEYERRQLCSGFWALALAEPAAQGTQLDLIWMSSGDPNIDPHKMELTAMLSGETERARPVHIGGTIDLSDQSAVVQRTRLVLPPDRVMVTRFTEGEGKPDRVCMVRVISSSPWTKTVDLGGSHSQRARYFPSSPLRRRTLGVAFDEVERFYRGPGTTTQRHSPAFAIESAGSLDIIESLMDDLSDSGVHYSRDSGVLAINCNRELSDADAMKVMDRIEGRLAALHSLPALFEVRTTLKDSSGAVTATSQSVVEAGAELLVASGDERRALGSYEVEVAQFAGVSDPIPSVELEGQFFKLRLRPLADGNLRAQFDGTYQAPLARKRSDLQSNYFTDYESTTYAWAEMQGLENLAPTSPGHWTGTWGGANGSAASIQIDIRELSH